MNVWAASPVGNLDGAGPQRLVNHGGHGRNLRVIISAIVGINGLLFDNTFFCSASWVSRPPFSRGLWKPDASACLRWYKHDVRTHVGIRRKITVAMHDAKGYAFTAPD